MKIKKVMLLIMIFIIGLFNMKDKSVKAEEKQEDMDVALTPAYLNLGSISEDAISFQISIRNEGKPVYLTAKVDDTKNTRIEISPNSFMLSEKEQKIVNVTLYNDTSLKNGVYDISIYFVPENQIKGAITAYGTNSLRLVFRKEGIALASCNVKNITPLWKEPFYSMLCNFYQESMIADARVTITNKASGKPVLEQSDFVTLKPYPSKGSYGTISTELPKSPLELGDYIYRLVVKQYGDILLEYKTEFNVGIVKGKLEKVFTKDVMRGEHGEFTSIIKNIGTQPLPVTVKIAVKDRRNNEIYSVEKTDSIAIGKTGKIKIEWPTKYNKIGRYSIDYLVKMGDQQETGILYYRLRSECLVWLILLCVVLLLFLILALCILLHRKYRIKYILRNVTRIKR